MRTPQPLVDLGLLLTRASLGLYFAMAGVYKIMGEINNGPGSFAASDSFKALSPTFMPGPLLTAYGYALPWAELIFGALLVIGVLSRISAGAIFLMLLSFLIAQLSADFSKYIAPGPGPFNTNFILLALSFLLFATGAGRYALAPRRTVVPAKRKKSGPKL